MSSQPAPALEKPSTQSEPLRIARSATIPDNLFARWDECLAVAAHSPAAIWANRFLLFGVMLFALALPHSIAAAHISLNLSFVAWLLRDLLMRRFHLARTPFDWPVLAFVGWTVVSACLSTEPGLSLPKLKSLLLFGSIYVLATNLSARAIKPVLLAFLLSGTVGVAFSFGDKLAGRGIIIKSIAADSPLLRDQPLNARLQPGDAIWMIGKQRIYSLADIRAALRHAPLGKRLDIEALHRGDPIPAAVTVTAELQADEDPLRISVGGRTQRFRVTGFGRQFQTYAEQMQLFALLCFGFLLVTRRGVLPLPWWLMSLLFTAFAFALVLTFTRAVLAAFLLTVLLLPLALRGKRTALFGVALVVLIGGLALNWLGTARSAEVMRDSTARRVEYMQAGLRMIPKHPLFGIGMDAAKRHWQEWGFPGDYVTHTHSTPIQIAMERGIPALLLLLWLWAASVALAWSAFRAASRNSIAKGLALGALGALLGFTFSSLVNYNFGDAEVLLLLLSFLALLQVSRQSDATPDLLISETPS